MEKNLLSTQNDLFLKAEETLLRFPKSGLYEGENPSDWIPFLKSVYDVFKKEEGPRAEIQKEISKIMREQKETFNSYLKLIDSNIFESIAIIHQKFTNFSPGLLYSQYCKVQKGLISLKSEIDDLQNKDSWLFQQIVKGLSGKNTDVLLMEVKISDILEKKKLKLNSLQGLLDSLEPQLSSNKIYQEWLQLSNIMRPFFEKWLNIDSQIGKDSNKRGLSFEEKCQIDLLPILGQKLQTKEFLIYKNIAWLDLPGEIDIVITNMSNDSVIGLAECKARLFDIAYGYYQSGPEGRILTGKKKIKINDKILQIDEKTPCFVISLIQENPYQLGFESKLKVSLNKYLLDLERVWTSEEIYQELKPKFQKKISPLDWFYKYSKDYLILL